MMLLLVLACDTPTAEMTCEDPLFGAPSDNTGLPDGACQSTCACTDFAPPEYGASEVAALRNWRLEAPLDELGTDPYLESAPSGGGVCAVRLSGDTYTLETHDSRAAADAAGAVPTHGGACGVCSTLQDLAAYIDHPDLTVPVRQCGVDGFFGPEEDHLACLMDLGFTRPCAQIWRYNTKHTQETCIQSCLALLDAPHHDASGDLNDCIQCDEDNSGPVFKAIAGRTRRNSGLPSALCRPCDTVFPVVHRY